MGINNPINLSNYTGDVTVNGVVNAEAFNASYLGDFSGASLNSSNQPNGARSWSPYFYSDLVTSNGLGWINGKGAGGTITQATSKSTAVSLNKTCGKITMNAAALNAGVAVSFTFNNTKITANSNVIVQIGSGATAASYTVTVDNIQANSCRITVRNYTAGNLSEALVLHFSVLKNPVD